MQWSYHRHCGTYLCRVEDERADVSMRLALDLVDSFWGCNTDDNDASLLLKIEDERKAEGRISSEDDCVR